MDISTIIDYVRTFFAQIFSLNLTSGISTVIDYVRTFFANLFSLDFAGIIEKITAIISSIG